MRVHRLFAILGIAFIAFSQLAANAETPVVGQLAPDFKAVTLDGEKVTLSGLRGSVILLNFWATWCGPCKKEMPLLDSYYRKLKDRGFVVLAIATEDSLPANKLRPLSEALSFPLIRSLSGPYGSIRRSLPTSYVIDRAGVIRYADAGMFTPEMLNDLVMPLVNEPGPRRNDHMTEPTL